MELDGLGGSNLRIFCLLQAFDSTDGKERFDFALGILLAFGMESQGATGQVEQEVTVLGIESSCDETAVSVMRGDGQRCQILSSEIASQIKLHREYGGVVPELASRNHGLQMKQVLDQAIETAGVAVDGVDVFCATAGPGLASSLLIGHTAGKALSVAAGNPFVSVNHMEGPLLSPFIEQERGIEENIALVVSGGHTMIIYCKGSGEYELLGRTKDDAAGEAFDKVAKMLGLPYPGGPEIEKMAKQGDPKAFQFPRSMKNKGLDFSFSGLKTAVLYTLSELDPELGKAPEEHLANLCASFQEAVLEVLVLKAIRAAKERGVKHITVSGGVSCNTALREALATAAERRGMEFSVCSRHLSADNAAMIAYVGLHKHLAGEHDGLDCDVDPNFPLNMMQMRK